MKYWLYISKLDVYYFGALKFFHLSLTILLSSGRLSNFSDPLCSDQRYLSLFTLYLFSPRVFYISINTWVCQFVVDLLFSVGGKLLIMVSHSNRSYRWSLASTPARNTTHKIITTMITGSYAHLTFCCSHIFCWLVSLHVCSPVIITYCLDGCYPSLFILSYLIIFKLLSLC